MDENRIEEFDEGFDVSAPDDAGKTLKRLWSSVSDQHRRLLIVLVSVIFYTFLSIAAPLYSADIVDLLWEKIKASLAEGATFSITWNDGGREIFGLLIIYLATGLFYLIQSFLMASFAEKLSLRLRSEIGEKLSRMPLAFFDKNKPGAVLSRITNDLDKMAEAFQTGVLKLFTSVGMIAGSLVMMFRFSVLLTVVFLTFMGISLLVTKIVSAKTLRSALERQQRVSDVTALVEEGYSGRVIIKAFNQEGESSHKMHKATEELAEATRKADFMINAINPAIRFINRLGQILIAVSISFIMPATCPAISDPLFVSPSKTALFNDPKVNFSSSSRSAPLFSSSQYSLVMEFLSTLTGAPALLPVTAVLLSLADSTACL